MKNVIDDSRLVKEQYKTADNLASRINIYNYNINKTDFHKWCFNRMHFPSNAKILELGCGNGVFWYNNKEKIKDDWKVTLSDFSVGMLQSAKQKLGDMSNKFTYEIIDVQNIPHENNSFDIVIAKHMLYHVPDIEKALSEIKRVLSDSGIFYASTNAKEHLSELHELAENFDAELVPNNMADKFGLENGWNLLKKYFKNVDTQIFGGKLVIAEAEPIVSFVASTLKGVSLLVGDKRDEFVKYVEDCIKEKGSISIATKACLFTAKN